MLKKLTILLLAVLAVSCPGRVAPQALRDAEGRIVIYHGVNVCNHAKYAPDFLPWQTREDFMRLRGWGFNLVRYLVFWEAIEPEPGVYDTAYLDATKERIQWLGEAGIDVVVDLHQDLCGRHYGGSGFPEWMRDDDGIPFTPRQPWNLNYLEPAVLACLENFWESHPMQDRYLNMAARLLEEVDPLPNVVGLDLINEPFNGFHLRFEPDTLSDLYKRAFALCRERGFRIPIYFEPMMLSSGGLASTLRLTPAPGAVYTPHYYDPLCHEGASYTARARLWMEAVLAQRARDGAIFQTPVFIGEFGIASSVDGYLDYLTDFLDLAERHQFSWAYYSYDKASDEAFAIVDADGNEREHLTRLVRVYAQRIAGENPVSRREPNAFHLEYDIAGQTAPTVIFVPSSLAGVSVTVNDVAFAFDAATQCLEIPAMRPQGQRQRVVVRWL